jgi:cytoskeleton protein RodZ
VYAKGHLRRYAALLGLPVAEIMAGYESRSLAPKTPVPPPAVRLRTDAPAVSNLPWTQIVGTALVLCLVIGVLWWKPWHQRGAALQSGGTAPAAVAAPSTVRATESEEAAAGAASSSTPAPPAAATASAPPPSPGSAAATQALAPTALPDVVAGAGRARLRLSFSADSWVDVHDADGRRVFAGNGRANTMRTVAGSAPMRVYLGMAGGVQLEINNRTVAIGPQFVFGDVARFEAGADGVLRRDSRVAAPASATPGAAPPGATATQPRNARPAG